MYVRAIDHYNKFNTFNKFNKFNKVNRSAKCHGDGRRHIFFVAYSFSWRFSPSLDMISPKFEVMSIYSRPGLPGTVLE